MKKLLQLQTELKKKLFYFVLFYSLKNKTYTI